MEVIEVLHEFNDWYPYERYIMKKPANIDLTFDDFVLTELFVPKVEVKHDKDGTVIDKLDYHTDEIYAKFRLSDGHEFRMSFDDIADHVQEDIVGYLIEDFGDYEWECMYVDHGDGEPELKEVLDNQRRLIKEKYNEDVPEWVCDWEETEDA